MRCPGNLNLSVSSGYLVNSVHMIKVMQVIGVIGISLEVFVSTDFQEYKKLIKTHYRE